MQSTVVQSSYSACKNVWCSELCSNASSSLSSNYRRHENIKKRAYACCVREVEHATFTPLVMSASGSFAHETSIFYKRLTSLLAIDKVG